MPLFTRVMIAALLSGGSLLIPAAASPTLPLEVQSLPDLPFDPRGGFLAEIEGTLVAAGDGGVGMELWTSKADGGSAWEKIGIPSPRFAAAARYGTGWVVVGGIVDGAPSARVGRLSSESGKVAISPLPDLPEAVAGASAAVIGDSLYVLGGSPSANGGTSAKFWILDLKTPDAKWTAGPDFPGPARAFAAATQQYGMFCVFGGTGTEGRALSDTWLFRPVPLEGTKDSGWRKLSDVPYASPRSAAVPMGQAQVMLLPGAGQAGGDRGRPLLFHTLTDAWCAFDASPGIDEPAAVKTGEGIVALGVNASGAFRAVDLRSHRSVRDLAWPDYVIIVFYFAFLASIGWFFSRKQESSAEFSLGNRKVLWWAAGISMFATGASAISFMAIPALAFATNLVWLFPLVALIPGYFVTAYLIYPMLRRMEITSTYEYLERRFNRLLRVIASLQCIVFQTFARAAVVLVLPSLAISSMTGINVYTSVLIMGIVTTIYTAIGGFDAVIWTEVFQGVLKFFAPLAMILVCIASLPGGFGEFVRIGRDYGKFDFAIATWDVTVPAFWVLILGTFLTVTVSSAGDQPIIQRIFSAPLKEVRRVNATFTVCGILIGIISNVVGLAIFAYFRAHPEKFDPSAQNDQIVPMFVAQGMPVGMAGVVVAAIFASAMATVASAMNSVATIFTEDFYMKLRPQASDKDRLRTLKATSYVVGAIGTVMALVLAAQDLKSMMVIWNQMVALIGGGIVGVYSLGMFSTRANGFGAVCGAVISVVITLLVKLYTPLHWGTYIPIAIFSCIFFGYFFSLFRPARADLRGLTVFTPVNAGDAAR